MDERAPADVGTAQEAAPGSGVRRMLPPMISYAQNFEDVLLRRALSEIERGFYVDIGAFHPVVDSVTCWFYSRGWSGINVEPNPRFHALLREARPHDINLAAAVTDSSGEIDLHLLDGLSTTVETVAGQHARTGRASEGTARVKAYSLPDLFAQHAGTRTIDFLKIDVEGAEAAVLDACLFDEVRPRIIVVEATEPDSVAQSAATWEDGLLRKGYLFCYFDGLNRFYVREEDSWRRALFDAPPNVFDSFHLAQTDRRIDFVATARGVSDQTPEGGVVPLIADRDRWAAQAQALRDERDALSVALNAERIGHENILYQERVALSVALNAERIGHRNILRQERAAFARRLAALIRDQEGERRRMEASEREVENLSTLRDASLLANARLQIKLDALRDLSNVLPSPANA